MHTTFHSDVLDACWENEFPLKDHSNCYKMNTMRVRVRLKRNKDKCWSNYFAYGSARVALSIDYFMDCSLSEYISRYAWAITELLFFGWSNTATTKHLHSRETKSGPAQRQMKWIWMQWGIRRAQNISFVLICNPRTSLTEERTVTKTLGYRTS